MLHAIKDLLTQWSPSHRSVLRTSQQLPSKQYNEIYSQLRADVAKEFEEEHKLWVARKNALVRSLELMSAAMLDAGFENLANDLTEKILSNPEFLK